MSVDYIPLRDSQGSIYGISITIDGDESINNFKQLVNRAMNCWDTAPPELKAFADQLIEGRILQDYFQEAKITGTYGGTD